MPLPRLSDLLRTPGEPRRRFPAGRAQRGPAPPGRRPSAAAFREGEQRPCHPPASRAAGDAGPQAVPRAHSPRRTAEAPSDGAGGSQRFPPPAGRAGRGGYGAGSGAGTGRDQGRAAPQPRRETGTVGPCFVFAGRARKCQRFMSSNGDKGLYPATLSE